MRGVRSGGLLATVVWFASACDGSLRFDETPRDASVSETVVEVPAADGARDGGAETDAICADPRACGWQITECDSTEDDACELHCEPGRACTNSVCGTTCGAECKTDSSCSLTTGAGGHVECNTGASCTFIVGVGGNATCDPGSNCRLQCTGLCSLTCQPGATCQLRCADATEAHPVSGKGTCS